ncbi:hypothetical protein Scep_026651 [Stephania cephalantha]|uniref:Uncharacterized protein n=1 Tax=Stephania cephalantha TaxID=152367 RepID=A0AAP0ENQ6_9MAGN
MKKTTKNRKEGDREGEQWRVTHDGRRLPARLRREKSERQAADIAPKIGGDRAKQAAGHSSGGCAMETAARTALRGASVAAARREWLVGGGSKGARGGWWRRERWRWRRELMAGDVDIGEGGRQAHGEAPVTPTWGRFSQRDGAEGPDESDRRSEWRSGKCGGMAAAWWCARQWRHGASSAKRTADDK